MIEVNLQGKDQLMNHARVIWKTFSWSTVSSNMQCMEFDGIEGFTVKKGGYENPMDG